MNGIIFNVYNYKFSNISYSVFNISTTIIGNPTSTRGKAKTYVDSDFIRASEDELKQLKRTPRRIISDFTVHGGLDYDPEAIAHHFPALTIGGEGDPAFLDTLLSYYN